MSLFGLSYRTFNSVNSIIQEVDSLGFGSWKTISLKKDDLGLYIMPDSNTMIEILRDLMDSLISIYKGKFLDFFTAHNPEYMDRLSKLMLEVEELTNEECEVYKLSKLKISWFDFCVFARTLFEFSVEEIENLYPSPKEALIELENYIAESTGFLMFQAIELMRLTEECEAMAKAEVGTLH